MKTILFLTLVFVVSASAALAQTETRTRTAAADAGKEIEQDIDNTPDPIASLRDQIAGATASERNRLRLKLADLLLSTGHEDEALAELNAIAKSNSFDPISFYNLGNSFARLGETDAAISAYRTAIEQRNGKYSRALNNLGVVLVRAGRWDEAQDALLSALKVENFRYAEASYNLGRVYLAQGQNDLAAREWRRALAVDPKHDAAKQALAGGTDGLIVVRPKAVKTSRRTPVKRQPEEVKAPAAKEPLSPVASSASATLTLDQSSFDFLQRARDAAERGKMKEAVDNFRRVISREGGYFPPANLELSYVLLSLKRYDEALASLLEVSRRDGARYPISYFHIGRVYELKGEMKLAEAAFAQAATASAVSNPVFFLDLSRVREKLGDFKGALEAMEQYVSSFQKQGQKPVWFDDRLAELRRKAGN